MNFDFPDGKIKEITHVHSKRDRQLLSADEVLELVRRRREGKQIMNLPKFSGAMTKCPKCGPAGAKEISEAVLSLDGIAIYFLCTILYEVIVSHKRGRQQKWKK